MAGGPDVRPPLVPLRCWLLRAAALERLRLRPQIVASVQRIAHDRVRSYRTVAGDLRGVALICALLGRTVERLGLPIVFVFLALGMLAGSEGIGGIHFADYQFAFRLGTIALILILLDGGLNAPLQTVRRSLAPAGLLATIGSC